MGSDRNVTAFHKPVIVFMLLSVFSACACAAELTGLWEEYNDDTGKPEALIRIENTHDDIFEGRIEKLLPDTAENAATICKVCPGDMRNRPLLGLRILSGMKRKSALDFDHGEIVDPDDGKTYSCQIKLSEDGNTLKVTGYIGISWIGQSEIWRRIK